MKPILKIIIFLAGTAIALPLLYPEKYLNWLPPYGANRANLYQSAGAQLAGLPSLFAKKPPLEADENKIAQTQINLPQCAAFLLFNRQPDNTSGQTANGSEAENQPQPKETGPAGNIPQSVPAKTASAALQAQKDLSPVEKPYRILLAGDSFIAVAGGFGDIIEQKLLSFEDVSVLRKGKVSSGLSRTDYYDWPSQSQAMIDSFKPNIAIIMMGTNDAQPLTTIADSRKKIIPFGTAEWDNEYFRRASLFTGQFTGRGARVYWIGLPSMRAPDYDAKIKHLTDLQKEAASRDPNGIFIFADPIDGNAAAGYQPFLADTKGIMRATRNPDGIHLTYFGGTLLAEKVINELKKDLDFAAAGATKNDQ